jgi:7,8-dihydroneopterin aldolase/epimerase/oxygenase
MIIALEGMKFYAHHGYYDAEREKGNDFIVDAYVTADLDEGLNDKLEHALNYELIFDCVKKEIKKPAKLLETVAVNILNELQKKFPSAISLRVRVSKLTPPLPGDVQRAFVELERKLK